MFLRKRYEAFHDLSLIVGRFGQFTNFSSNQSGFLECEVFPPCERTNLASNGLRHPQELTGFVYVLVRPGRHGLADCYVVFLRSRHRGNNPEKLEPKGPRMVTFNGAYGFWPLGVRAEERRDEQRR